MPAKSPQTPAPLRARTAPSTMPRRSSGGGSSRRARSGSSFRFSLGPRQRIALAGLALLALAALTALSLFDDSLALDLWRSGAYRLFGWGAYLLPVMLALAGGAVLLSLTPIQAPLTPARTVGWLALYLVFLSTLEIQGGEGPLGAWAGGWLGHALVASLVAVHVLLAALVLIGLTIAGGLLAFAIPPGVAWSVVRRGILAGAREAVALGSEIDSMRRQRKRAASATPAERPVQSGPLLRGLFGGRPGKKGAKVEPVEPEEATDPQAGTAPTRPSGPNRWKLPPIGLLEAGTGAELSEIDLREKAAIIEETLGDLGVAGRVVEIRPGPTVTQYGVEPGYHERRERDGTIVRRDKVKVREIVSLQNDLALALAATAIRIEAPVPGRSVVGIEVPNNVGATVTLRGELESPNFTKIRAKSKLSLALGRDVSGNTVVADLAKMPHLLIAGATGSGKSVCLNSIITTLLMHASPDELRMIMVDPKRVELTSFRDVPHLLAPVVDEPEKAVPALAQVVREMERRLKEFSQRGARNIDTYNRLALTKGFEPMPFIVVIVDELADLMMMAADDVEKSLQRLAQLARAAGIHVIVATQRPSVDVITGLIKANFPTRISFMVTSQIDSRTILDTPGAEKLLGRGDMLFLPSDAPKPMRLQGVYLSDEEIEKVVGHWKLQREVQYAPEFLQLPEWSPGAGDDEGEEELYERALEVAQEHQRISTSLLQRKLRVGYNRAARLMERLESDGVIGPAEGRAGRELLKREDSEVADD